MTLSQPAARKVAPYPCRHCGQGVQWREGHGWTLSAAEGKSFTEIETCPNSANGHVPEEQYL